MSLLNQILEAPAVQRYYTVAEELFDGIADSDGSGIRRYVKGFVASAEYQDAARTAFYYVAQVLRDLCAELGFDVATDIDSDFGTRVVNIIIFHPGSKSKGTHDCLESEQFKAGVIESEFRAEEQTKVAGYDF